MKHELRAALPMGLVGLIGGIGLGAYVAGDAPGEGWQQLPVFAGIAGLLSGTGFWWLILARKSRYTLWRGAVAGSLAGTFAHYLLWYLWILALNVAYWIGGRPLSSLGEPPVDPLTGLLGAAAFAFWGLLLLGWLTVPMGAIAGMLIAARQRRRC